MSEPTLPPKLRPGDTVRVIAPAQSRSLIMEHDNTRWINQRFTAMGLQLTFGEHVDEDDRFRSSSIDSRVADLHAAFADPGVHGILTVIGGFNSNELLPHLDWDLIARHPKVLCGYSDITALSNAILTRADLITYSGPHWSTFGMRDHFEPIGQWFHAAVMQDGPITLHPSQNWTDDLWFLDQDHRTVESNRGSLPIRSGTAAGRIVGGNLATLNLLQGTAYMPSLEDAILFVEEEGDVVAGEFARNFTSLLQLPGAEDLAGLAIGRFQRSSMISDEDLREIVDRQPALRDKPIVAGLDFGHTYPMITFPIGGQAELTVSDSDATVVITEH